MYTYSRSPQAPCLDRLLAPMLRTTSGFSHKRNFWGHCEWCLAIECKQTSTHTHILRCDECWVRQGRLKSGKHNNEEGHLTNCGAGRYLVAVELAVKRAGGSLYDHLPVNINNFQACVPGPRAVTMGLWEPKRKFLKAVPKTHPPKSCAVVTDMEYNKVSYAALKLTRS